MRYIQLGCWKGGPKAKAGPRCTYSEDVGCVGQRLRLDPEVHTVRVLEGRAKG